MKNFKRTLAVILPLIIVMAVASSFSFVKDGLNKDAMLSISILPDVTVQRMIAGRAERMPKLFIDQLKVLPHVVKVVPRIWGYVPVRIKDQDLAYTLMGIDLANADLTVSSDIFIEQGEFLEADDPKGCLIGKAFANSFNISVGDHFTLEDAFKNKSDFYVKGIFNSTVQIYTADLVLTSLEGAAKFFGFGHDEASDLAIYLDNPAYADLLSAEITEKFDNTRVFTRAALSELTQQTFGGRTGVFQMVWLVLLLTSALIAFAQASNITIDMRREIGILKAVGWGIGDIITLKVFESMIIGILGVLLGWVLTFFYLYLGAPGIKQYFLGWSTVYPEFPLPVYCDPGSMFLLFCVGVIPILFATVIPAWLTGIIDPDEAIRK